MNIAIISTLCSGGAADAAYNLHQALTALGENSHFCSLSTNTQRPVTALSQLHANCHTDFWAKALFNYWMQLVDSEKMQQGCSELFSSSCNGLFAISEEAKEIIHQADVINLHWAAGVLFSPELLTLLTNKRIVLTLHDMNAFTGGCHYHKSCLNFMNSCGFCPLLSCPNKEDASQNTLQLKKSIYSILMPTVVSPSRWLADLAKKSSALSSTAIHTIPNPHDQNIFYPFSIDERMRLRSQYNIGDTDCLVLCGAEDINNNRKNLRMFFDAWEKLRSSPEHGSVKLMLFGHGQYPALDGLVHAEGYVSCQTRLAELYNMADLYVHPSLLDNLPNTICQSQSCGTPVLCFAVGGSGEALIPGTSGFLAEEHTPDALAKAISDISQDRKLLFGMREKASQFAKKSFNYRAVALEYKKIFTAAECPNISEEKISHTSLESILAHNNTSSLASIFFHTLCDQQHTISALNKAIKDNKTEFENSRIIFNKEINELNAELNALSAEVSEMKNTRVLFRLLIKKIFNK